VLGKPVRRHQVHAGQELVGGEDAGQRLARAAEEERRAGARGQEDGLEAPLAHQLVERGRAADPAARRRRSLLSGGSLGPPANFTAGYFAWIDFR
jgi:hypothetical protein